MAAKLVSGKLRETDEHEAERTVRELALLVTIEEVDREDVAALFWIDGLKDWNL